MIGFNHELFADAIDLVLQVVDAIFDYDGSVGTCLEVSPLIQPRAGQNVLMKTMLFCSK